MTPLSELSIATRLAAYDSRLRFGGELKSAGHLDAAFVRRQSDTLIVTFHGALDREKFEIPRFERARSTEEFNASCLYWADPSLWLDSELALAWYTGTEHLDLSALLANLSTEVARSIGAQRIIFTGSSGGGFAALQASAQVPGSTALVFNPQTAIFRYWSQAQRKYLSVCAPSVLPANPEDMDFKSDWSETLDDRYSAVRRYATETESHVVYWTNVNDWHHEKHFQPFRAAIANSSASAERLTVREFDGPSGHNVPTAEIFKDALSECLEISNLNSSRH